MLYVPKTEQFSIQKTVLDATWDYPAYALWWEPGVGKTKGFIDNGGVLFCEGAVDSWLMIAPNGLHRNFITKELPKHLPDNIAEKCKSLFWRTDKSTTKWHQEEARSLLAHRDGLRVLAMSYDGVMTNAGRQLLWEYLNGGKVFYGVDESQRIKEPTAARTQRVLGSGPFAPFHRILTGTPVANAPWDVWTQIKFLKKDFWVPYGLDSIETMKAQFGEWDRAVKRVDLSMVKRQFSLDKFYNKNGVPECLRTQYVNKGGVGLQMIPTLRVNEDGAPQFKNLARLREILVPIRSRVLKSEVLDLPPKLYTPIEFDMSPAQWKAYRSMTEMGFVALESGDTMSASLALTVMLRLQQIACGYIVTDLDPSADPDEDPTILPITPNPRLDMLLELTEDLPHPALIWARFRADIDTICEGLRRQGKTFVRYDGSLTDDEAGDNEDRFHRGEAQFFVATQSKGSEGLTLIEAQTAFFYSNSFKLLERLQAEDRPYRYGQTHPVNNIDLIARGTIDEGLVQKLIAKFDVASAVTGDGWRKWMRRDGSLI